MAAPDRDKCVFCGRSLPVCLNGTMYPHLSANKVDMCKGSCRLGEVALNRFKKVRLGRAKR